MNQSVSHFSSPPARQSVSKSPTHYSVTKSDNQLTNPVSQPDTHLLLAIPPIIGSQSVSQSSNQLYRYSTQSGSEVSQPYQSVSQAANQSATSVSVSTGGWKPVRQMHCVFVCSLCKVKTNSFLSSSSHDLVISFVILVEVLIV